MSHSSAARLGGFSKERLTPAREINTNNITVLTPSARVDAADSDRTDFFIKRDGAEFAGTHLLVELWEARNLDDCALTEDALLDGARQAGATVLHSYMHPFGPEMGVSGVVVLAESHISIHTWPERGFAAVDIFMCGDCDPHKAIAALKRAFEPGRVEVSEYRRGLVE